MKPRALLQLLSAAMPGRSGRAVDQRTAPRQGTVPGGGPFWKTWTDALTGNVSRTPHPDEENRGRRRTRRYPALLTGHYVCTGGTRGQCSILDISARGVKVALEPGLALRVQDTLQLFIRTAFDPEPVRSSLQVRWAGASESTPCTAGGLLSGIDPVMHRNLLEQAFNTWYKNA